MMKLFVVFLTVTSALQINYGASCSDYETLCTGNTKCSHNDAKMKTDHSTLTMGIVGEDSAKSFARAAPFMYATNNHSLVWRSLMVCDASSITPSQKTLVQAQNACFDPIHACKYDAACWGMWQYIKANSGLPTTTTELGIDMSLQGYACGVSLFADLTGNVKVQTMANCFLDNLGYTNTMCFNKLAPMITKGCVSRYLWCQSDTACAKSLKDQTACALAAGVPADFQGDMAVSNLTHLNAAMACGMAYPHSMAGSVGACVLDAVGQKLSDYVADFTALKGCKTMIAKCQSDTVCAQAMVDVKQCAIDDGAVYDSDGFPTFQDDWCIVSNCAMANGHALASAVGQCVGSLHMPDGTPKHCFDKMMSEIGAAVVLFILLIFTGLFLAMGITAASCKCCGSACCVNKHAGKGTTAPREA